MDLPLQGATYTWTNNQDARVSSRLDRFSISSEWLELSEVFSQEALLNPGSDHIPTLFQASNRSLGP